MKKLTILSLFSAVVFSCNAATTTDITDKSTKKTPIRVYVTNFVQVPVVCATLDMADMTLEANHTYRLYVQEGARPWRYWGVIKSTTNTAARVWVPAASTRPMLWQVVDWTPGYNRAAVPKTPPDCVSKPQWVVLGVGNIRPVK
jgi:hypothetical protein